MTSTPVRDQAGDHLITPQSSALLLNRLPAESDRSGPLAMDHVRLRRATHAQAEQRDLIAVGQLPDGDFRAKAGRRRH